MNSTLFFVFRLGFDGDVWIGLADMDVEGIFTWQDYSSFYYHHWSSGEPNDYSPHSVLGGDCVRLKPSTRRWADDDCMQKYHFICKSDLRKCCFKI